MYVNLTVDQIIEFHDEELSRTNGLSGIKDMGHLELIIDKPFTEYFGEEQYPSLYLKAAVLMHGLITAHCFNDCNKRTALIATFTFLYLNGQMLDASNDDVFKMAIRVAKNRVNLGRLSIWIKNNCKPI